MLTYTQMSQNIMTTYAVGPPSAAKTRRDMNSTRPLKLSHVGCEGSCRG